MPIEAYLTLPLNASSKSPLIVFPHGGPIGVRDALEFDPAVQLFASLGYAVLQVNFRGSDGYGRAFREAGRHHYGSLIEDDIDAATRVALKDFPIDGSRLCAVGASYGGYSALVSAIRWPQRFRCADFDFRRQRPATDVHRAATPAWYESGRKTDLEKIIGNPATDGQAMREYSPLYRYRELTIPVMLAVHGTEDRQVDYEHSPHGWCGCSTLRAMTAGDADSGGRGPWRLRPEERDCDVDRRGRLPARASGCAWQPAATH